MSILTSNQRKRQSSLDPIFMLIYSILLVLLVFAISAANGNYYIEKVLQTYNSAPASLSLNGQVLFASDERYWSEHCVSGWSSDDTCDAIVARTQACSVSVDSAYCSTYESYLQEFDN